MRFLNPLKIRHQQVAKIPQNPFWRFRSKQTVRQILVEHSSFQNDRSQCAKRNSNRKMKTSNRLGFQTKTLCFKWSEFRTVLNVDSGLFGKRAENHFLPKVMPKILDSPAQLVVLFIQKELPQNAGVLQFANRTPNLPGGEQ